MRTQKLSSDDRTFFELVAQAAFANPFGEHRFELDRQILGNQKIPRGPEVVPELIGQIRQRLEGIDGAGLARIQDFPQAEQKLIESVFLFDVFHQFIEQLDRTIERQVLVGSESVSVDYGKEAIRTLSARGFERQRAVQLFSLFFQIRRAYYFIDRGLLGTCPSMQRFREDLWNTIFTHDLGLYEQGLWDSMEDFAVMLLGPTGAGKGAAAAAIGRSGYIPFDDKKGIFARSFTAAFVQVNLSQCAETLLESALFGHTKGAFTGAVAQHEGVFALCGEHGSIFLDEIGDVSTAIQIKLLKVLEEREFCPLGSHLAQRFQGRVIAATHRNVSTLRSEGLFRNDFYYRLCSDCIEVPSLQQRIQEDPRELDLLIGHTVERILGRPHHELASIVRQVIDERLGRDYAWPGNVRELAQCVRRVILRRDYQGDIGIAVQGPQDQLTRDIQAGALRAEELMARYCRLLYQRFGTYEEVARRTDLDRRTVKRYVEMSRKK